LIHRDISEIDAEQLLPAGSSTIDLVAGCPPCQGFNGCGGGIVRELLPMTASPATAWESPSATSTTMARPDVLLTGYGGSFLFLNNGNGTFTDVTQGGGD
jgi:hypothetical protein